MMLQERASSQPVHLEVEVPAVILGIKVGTVSMWTQMEMLKSGSTSWSGLSPGTDPRKVLNWMAQGFDISFRDGWEYLWTFEDEGLMT